MGMKVKKYFASSMRRALELVRQEQGPDVMILSNRKVDGGIELVTAVEQPDATRSDTVSRPAATALPPMSPVAEDIEVETRVDEDVASGARLWTDQSITVQMQAELKSLRAMIERQMPSIAWRDFGYEHPVQATLVRELAQLGLHPRCARGVASAISDELDMDAAWRRCLGVLSHRIPIAPDGFVESGGTVALVGPAGVGKSTVAAKAAAQFALRHGADTVAVVTTDNLRLGAHQQLRSFGRIVGVHVRIVNDPAALRGCLEELQRCKLVVIDTPGLPAGDTRMQEIAQALRVPHLGVQSQLVVAATTDYRTLAKEVDEFLNLDPVAMVLTRLDAAARLGPAISVLAEREVPLSYVSAGQRIPEDLVRAKAHQLVARAVTLAAPGAKVTDNLEFEQAFAH